VSRTTAELRQECEPLKADLRELKDLMSSSVNWQLADLDS
jgi:hypothetical protein